MHSLDCISQLLVLRSDPIFAFNLLAIFKSQWSVPVRDVLCVYVSRLHHFNGSLIPLKFWAPLENPLHHVCYLRIALDLVNLFSAVGTFRFGVLK